MSAHQLNMISQDKQIGDYSSHKQNGQLVISSNQLQIKEGQNQMLLNENINSNFQLNKNSQQQLIGQSTGQQIQRFNNTTPNGGSSNSLSNQNNQVFQNQDNYNNSQNSNQQPSTINGNNYKVIKTYQKLGVAGGSSATNFSSQNTTQSSRKRGSQNQHQSQSQSQQQMLAAQQEIALIREQCIFCQKFTAYRSFGPLLNKALYSKYSSSQNYFYSKDINDILGNVSTKVVIRFRDLETYDEEEEFLKRFYHKNQQPVKMRDLTEYYKYHKDIPRLFMVSIGNVMNRYHDKRRRIEYQRIKKQLNFETSNNNNSEDSQLNTEEEDSNGNKASKKKEIPKECSNMLQELDVTLSFHQRMENKIKHINIDGTSNNQHISANYNGMNAFYMNQQPNKVYLQQQNRPQSNIFDMSSMMQKASNKNFFPAQAASYNGNSKIALQNQIQFNYYKAGEFGNENESSYQLSRILQSFQHNADDKYFYSIETSMSNMNNILNTQTDDLSFLSNQNIQFQQQTQPSRIQYPQNSINNKIVPTLNFSKNNKNTQNNMQPTLNEDVQSQIHSKNKQMAENAILNQKYQSILSQNQIKQQQQSSSSGSSNNYTSNSQQMLNPFQEIHSNLPNQKLSNIIQEQQIKMQKALLNNGMQLSSNNIDGIQKQSTNQLPSQQKIQQNISSSQSSSNSLVKQNNINSNLFIKQPSSSSNNNLGGKEGGLSIDKLASQSQSTTNQQKQTINAKQIMKVLTQNQNSSNNKNAGFSNSNQPVTATNSPQTSLIEKDSKQANSQQSQQAQIIDQLKVNNQVGNNQNTNNNQALTRNKSNQSISQKILQKRASDNIYSSASVNPLLQCSTRIPSTQKNSQNINAINQMPFQANNNQNSNNSTNISNNNMKKNEIDSNKQQQIERRYQTAERERIFSERKELNDKFSITNTINQLKQSEKQSPTIKIQQQNLLSSQQQSSQNQILQIMSQRQSKEQIYTQKQQQFEQYQLKQNVNNNNTPATTSNTSRPRSSLHQNSASQSSNPKHSTNKAQQVQINPLFQTLRQQNIQQTISNISSNVNSQINNMKCESMPSSSALNNQTIQNQQHSQLSSTLQFLTSQNSQNNLQFSQLQVISDGSSSPQQLFYQNQQPQLLLNDLQSHYHYSSPNTNNNPDKLHNNNGDLRIKKRKEGQTSLNVKGSSITGVSGLVGSSSNMNFSQLSQINQPNISQISQQVQQQQQQPQQSSRNHLKSQNSSQKKIKHSQHQAPQLDIQQQIQVQMNSNNNLLSQNSSSQQAPSISQTNFFNSKRNSQIQQLNPDLIKTQVYKTQSTFGNNQNQKNRSSSNPKQLKFPLNANNYNSNFINSGNVQIPKNQNFILQYDTNTPNSAALQSSIQQHSSQQQQQLANYQQQQQVIQLQQQQQQQQQQLQQVQQGKHQKSNSIAIQPGNNNIYKQSSVSSHTNFNSNHSQTSSQPNLLSSSLLNQLPQNMNVLNGINTQPASTKIPNSNSISNQANTGNGINSNNNFTQINLQLIKNYNTGSTNIINSNNQNSNDITNTLTIGTPVYQQSNQGMQKHSRTRSQELITNQMNIIGSSTARNNDNLNANQQQIMNNLPGGVSQINQVYEHKYHYNQPQSVRNKAERTTSTHFSDSIKRLIEQNTISSSSTTTNRTGSMISAQQFISSKQKSQIQSNQNLTNNSSKYYNQNMTNSPVSIRKNIMNSNNNNGNANNNNQNNLKKMNRIDTFAARVSNMINIFDPNQQNSQHVLTNLHNNSGGVNNINSTLSNFNTNQIPQTQQQLANNSNNLNHNINTTLNNNQVANNSNYTTQSNQVNIQNYPPSARINLNAKNSSIISHTGSLSRNNSPSKQKPIGELNIQQNQMTGSISPQMINSGSTGALQLNYQVPQNFIPSSTQSNTAQNLSQQISNSSRNASSQRGASKASQLIRYRQNNQ
ncbi:hypothetical protein TTHERM_01043230 (macronuclear) [Tetrahymena thermophila SB210]|uniref:Uncharacterized protein n=1 Tax=Tetrahymena thermophila (strain SB210) TaxID=312017 RepID=Q22CI6_TETTS|nr:hypothetical protein TTHERM_01043230 [Tetrahymena thermophila SB210]EAR83006.1 hypothetical protein TTHERM_01043230 [Tetrahymena thermophila SB210]|eukprot:XP_001030669.1 hypothetical protein TTHERM_01043230 [Tetrahymena thermophila SB210]